MTFFITLELFINNGVYKNIVVIGVTYVDNINNILKNILDANLLNYTTPHPMVYGQRFHMYIKLIVYLAVNEPLLIQKEPRCFYLWMKYHVGRRYPSQLV